jgi:hypothetical protein
MQCWQGGVSLSLRSRRRDQQVQNACFPKTCHKEESIREKGLGMEFEAIRVCLIVMRIFRRVGLERNGAAIQTTEDDQ